MFSFQNVEIIGSSLFDKMSTLCSNVINLAGAGSIKYYGTPPRWALNALGSSNMILTVINKIVEWAKASDQVQC